MDYIKWLNKFKKLNFGINLPSTIEEVREIEKIIDFNFSNEIIEMYLLMDGQKHKAFTDEYFYYLMPMNEIKATFLSLENKDFVPIFDFAFGCDYVGFVKNKQGLFFYEGSLSKGEYVVAYDSIEEFLKWAFKY